MGIRSTVIRTIALQGPSWYADDPGVVEFSTPVSAVLALIIAVAVLSSLHTLASLMRNEFHVHELKRNIARLQLRYLASMQAEADGELGEVEILDDDGSVIEVDAADPMDAPDAEPVEAIEIVETGAAA